MVCLLHEKPFASVAGSGKHNNWSLCTDTGKNLFKPGRTPRQNAQFLVFLAAFIKGVDEYQDFLRSTVAYAGNDNRLGLSEAPPAIISIFLGDELTAVVDSIINGTNYTEPEKSLMRIGVDVLPSIPKDTTDRNRTSPVAFTGNKFEFRMLGSSQTLAGPNIALNTNMAEELGKFADILENATDFDSALQKLICDTLTAHQRIIFNGNGYSDEWKEEAAKRGLSNHCNTAQSLPTYVSQKNIDLVTKRGIFTESEFRARYQIHLQSYVKVTAIEGRTCVDMALHQILPAALHYTRDLTKSILKKQEIGLTCKAEQALAERLSAACDRVYDKSQTLSAHLANIPTDMEKASIYMSDTVLPAMQTLREDADILEQLTDKSYWPYPTYSDLLFY